MDPPVANRPKKSKTKKAPIKAITKTIPAAPPVPSANVITTNKPKITFHALNLPVIPQINQASATIEASNTQASSSTTQPKKASKTKRITAKAAQSSQFPAGSESVTIQIKSSLQALNLPVIPQAIQAPVASESANSQALLASTRPKKAYKAKKADNKGVASAAEISLAPSTAYTATIQGQITSTQIKNASKAKKATIKGTNTDPELLESPDATETATRQIEASTAAIWPKKSKGKKAANKGPNSVCEISEAPPATQMVTNQALAATLRVKRGFRAQKVATKAWTTESQNQIEQGAWAKMATSQTNVSALETQVAAAVQALADDYLAQLSLEPTTRTQGKRKQKVRFLTSPSLTISFPFLSSQFVHLLYKSLLNLFTLNQSLCSYKLWEMLRRM